MKVHSIRIGHATNSSSTHSIILIPGGAKRHDTGHTDFGWEFFTAATEESKKNYLAIALRDAVKENCGEEIADVVAKEWVGVSPDGGYIDHQSSPTLPSAWDGKGVDKTFFDEFSAYILRDDVVILGGNDNTDQSHPLASKGKNVGWYRSFPIEQGAGNIVARKDGAYWTLFNRSTGVKMRVSFGDGALAVPPVKSRAPELVDVKITDFCPIGCEFCYQDSTTKGKHAPENDIRTLARTLGELRVFEVAIGGGEPTMHPQFEEILKSFRYYGIVPNFTTKSTHWMDKPTIVAAVLESGGSFAYSINTVAELREVLPRLQSFKGRAHVQHVMGVDENEQAFKELLTACAEEHIPLTLLGYKTVGRGKSLLAKDYSWWLDVVLAVGKEKYLRVGIDTALAAQYVEQLHAARIPSRLFEVKEGAFSMYIDAVTKTAGPSSYAPEKMGALAFGYGMDEEITKSFASYA